MGTFETGMATSMVAILELPDDASIATIKKKTD
jgi:hypothetical protein